MKRQTLYKIHLWLSLPLGILITIICLSGATLVFKNEIRNALGMPRVVAPHNTHHSAYKTGSNRHAASHNATARQSGRHGKAGNDSPYGTTTKRDFFSYVTKFHTGLMMGKPGKLIVTYTTLFFAIILISGISICTPKNRRQWRQRLSVERKKGIRRLIYDLHVSLGWWTVIWLLLLAVTGLGFGLKLVPKGTATMVLFHQLHIGAWGGTVTRVITFAASLIGASLPITGYWLYFKKRRQKSA